jgi:hypothetical protein
VNTPIKRACTMTEMEKMNAKLIKLLENDVEEF